MVSICTWGALPKTQKRVMTLRERPFGDTSNAATVAVTKRNVMFRYFWKISSVTPFVDTATVAVSDVPLYGLSGNVKYRNLYLLPRKLYLLPLTVKVAQHHNAPSSFGSERHVKKDSTFFSH
jgi:hypothetical protein